MPSSCLARKRREINSEQDSPLADSTPNSSVGTHRISKGLGLLSFLSCCQAHAGQMQVESRGQRDAAIGAGCWEAQWKRIPRMRGDTLYSLGNIIQDHRKTAGYTMHGSPRQFNLEAYKGFMASYSHGGVLPSLSRTERATSSSQQ